MDVDAELCLTLDVVSTTQQTLGGVAGVLRGLQPHCKAAWPPLCRLFCVLLGFCKNMTSGPMDVDGELCLTLDVVTTTQQTL
jgi:hypothetical protein